jgi:hypothetical protein
VSRQQNQLATPLREQKAKIIMRKNFLAEKFSYLLPVPLTPVINLYF